MHKFSLICLMLPWLLCLPASYVCSGVLDRCCKSGLAHGSAAPSMWTRGSRLETCAFSQENAVFTPCQ